MNLYDEDDFKKQKKQGISSTKKIIIISILLIVILIGVLTILIAYMSANPTKITAAIDGEQVTGFVELLDFQTNEKGETEVYFPIKDVANFFNYTGYNGEYKMASEETDKCYVINEDNEVSMFSLKSNTIYKMNLQTNSSEYDYCTIDKAVFESKGKLYTTLDGAKKGFNITFDYDEKKKKITIHTLPYLADIYNKDLEKKTIGSYGKVEVDDTLNNWKALFDGMLVVKAENKKYGVISTKDYSIILEPKYDNIEYIQYSSDFLIKTNGKIGLLSKEGKTKINATYDELVLMDRNAKLYRNKKGNQYGVITENEQTVIYTEFEDIGIDISSFATNGIKSGYIILNKLIPVKQNKKWAFYNLKGENITKGFIYDEIGCKDASENNVFALLEIPNYDIIVVGKDKKYSFMDVTGNENILPFIFDKIFMKIESGQISYWMKYNNRDWPVIKYLNEKGITEKQKTQ